MRCLRSPYRALRPLTPPQESNILHSFENRCGVPTTRRAHASSVVRRACQRRRPDRVRLGPGTLVGHRQAFNGTSLSGWRPEGPATWRAAGGEIVGAAASGPGLAGARQELSGHHPEVRLSLRRLRCGRRAAQRRPPSKPGTATALYVGLSGPDARTLYRVTLDAAGQGDRAHESLQVDGASEPAQACRLRITPGPERMDQRAHPGAR